MKPYYDHDGIVVYHGDCRKILPRIEEELSVMVLDPPYGIKYRSNRKESNWNNASKWLGKPIKGDEDTQLRDEIIGWWDERGPAYVFGTWKMPRPAGTQFQLVYDKGGAAGMGNLSIPFKPSHEEIYCLGTGFVGKRDHGSVLQGRVQCTSRNGRQHPNEKDARTIRLLISKTNPGTVVDPCMGSGPTLVAAKQLGRRAIGIDVEEWCCEVAVTRLAQQVLNFESLSRTNI